MSAGQWRIALASSVGTSHESTGAPCQDSAALANIDTPNGPVLVAAVSDGAGTAAHSEVGSSLAVSRFIELVQAFFEQGGDLLDVDHDISRQWLRETTKTVSFVADSQGHEARDYACTLLASLVGESHAAFIQVGDGAIVVSHGEDDGWSYVFWPQHGEYVNTTNFIQSPDLAEVAEFDAAPRCIKEFAMFSDGIENLVLHKADRSVQQSFFRDMIRPVRKAAVGLDDTLSAGLRSYLASPLICDRTDDDKTLLLATRMQARDAT